MCRCFQIWQEKVWTETRLIFVLFLLPQVWNISKKISILDEFHGLVPLFSKCRFTDKLWGILYAVRVKRSLNQKYSFAFSPNIQNWHPFAFCLHTFVFLKSIDLNKTSQWTSECVQTTVGVVKTTPRGILNRSKTKRLIAMPRRKTG